MNLATSIRTRENILTLGVQGVGKSAAVLTIARRCPQSTFYVFDTEMKNYDRLLDTAFSDVAAVGNVDVRPVYEWGTGEQSLWKQAEKVNADMQRDDWLVIDPITPTWDWVQSWFIEQVHGDTVEDFFLQQRIKKESTRGTAESSDGFSAMVGQDGDWQVINQQYFKLYQAIVNCPGHVYLAAEQTEVKQGKRPDDKQTIATFGPYGVKPKGQKRLGHIPSTVLWLTKSRVGEYQMTTIKDRGRSEMEGVPLADFSIDYMMKVAGWKPVAG